MSDSIETPRLYLRPFERADLEAAHQWFGDPLVMRYTPTGPDRSLEQTAERIAGYRRHQAEHGFSKWLVLDKASGEPIGDAGLLVLDDSCGWPAWVDLGFRFVPRAWGKGLATEVGAAWVSAAFDRVGLDELGAFAHRDNAASLRVLEKLGFARRDERVIWGMPSVWFTRDCRVP